jgi:hypothetical protein
VKILFIIVPKQPYRDSRSTLKNVRTNVFLSGIVLMPMAPPLNSYFLAILE